MNTPYPSGGFFQVTMIAGLLFFASLFSAHGENFSLQDVRTGETYGPFVYADGAIVALGASEYTLKRVSEDKTLLTEHLIDGIVIPSVQFHDAPLSEALNFLAVSSHSGIEQPRVNILAKNMPIPEPRVSLSLDNMSIRDVLSACCDAVGCSYSIQSNGIVVVEFP